MFTNGNLPLSRISDSYSFDVGLGVEIPGLLILARTGLVQMAYYQDQDPPVSLITRVVD